MSTPDYIYISPTVRDSLTKLIFSSQEETCALLFGKKIGKSIYYNEMVVSENIKHSPDSFEMAPDFIWKTITNYEEKHSDMTVMGIFHSHPSKECTPSKIDLQCMRGWDIPWLIGSNVSNLMIKAFLLLKDQVYEVPVRFNDFKEGLT